MTNIMLQCFAPLIVLAFLALWFVLGLCAAAARAEDQAAAIERRMAQAPEDPHANADA